MTKASPAFLHSAALHLIGFPSWMETEDFLSMVNDGL